MTREPASARLVARLSEVTVFPSLAPALVSRITLGGAPGAENSTAVRRLRNASAAGDLGSLIMMRSGPNPPPFPFGPGVAGVAAAPAGRGSARRASAKFGTVASV